MKVVLVFRDKRKGGKSIEGVFQRIISDNLPGIQLQPWEYNSDSSFLTNLRTLRSIPADIFHITGDINYLAGFLPGKKVIITIHDIGRYKELQGIKRQLYKFGWIVWPARIARRITVVSDFTRNDLLRLLPKMERKIQVIPNGIHPSFKSTPKVFNTACPRILQVGTAVHKNIETVFTSLHGLDCIVSIVGQLTGEHRRQLAKLRITFENYVDLDSDALREEYEKCDLVVFVSLHEGFGLPIVEAQAVGRPVITSKMASIPEVAGDGALFINDPLDAKELRAAMDRLMKDAAFRGTLIDKGFKNAQRYTYDNMAKAYMKLYQEVGAE